ncbi:MAG: pyridoxal phosphate-dependent aminotransferase [Candidatus Sericytochromatia bacterium]|nr:pyridoxal phosphate-dependent aminotransferase [Candidatus Sericytochromatia bacterium]
MKITNFDLEKWYVKYEFSSKYNLSASGIKPNNLSYLNLDDNYKNIPLTYSPANGNAELIKIISEMNNVSMQEVLVTNGAIEAIFLAQMAIMNKGDKLITVKPTYPALYQVAQDLGVEVIDWKLDFKNSFIPNLTELEDLIIGHKPKLLVINFPNNPTGATIKLEDLEEICFMCEKYNCYLLSDEIYKNLSINDNSKSEQINAYKFYEKSISINSLSKAYGFAGLRIGWMIADPDIIEKCTNLRHYTSLCNNTLGEHFAINILNNSEKYLDESNNHAKKNYAILEKKLALWNKRFKIKYVKPEAGVMVFIKMPQVSDTEDFCVKFEEKTGILLLPGNKYGQDYKNFFRMGFGGETHDLIYCLDKLELFLSKYFIS